MALTRIDSYLIDLDAIGGIDFDVQAGVPTLKVDETTHRVGIGTNNPNGLLSLSKDSGKLLTLRNSTTGFGANDGSYLALNGSDLQISNAEAADLIVYTNDTERLRITSTGNVGIGTDNTYNIKLFVRKNDATTYSPTSFNGHTHTFLDNATNGGYTNLILGCTSATTGNSCYAGIAVVSENASDTNGALTIGTRGPGGPDVTEKVRVTSTGNVGIGITNPSEKLEVNGYIKMSDTPGTNTNAELDVLFQTATGVIDGGSGLTYNPASDYLKVSGGNNNTVYGQSSLSVGGSGPYTIAAANHSSNVNIKVSDKIELNGNVGIGTDNPNAPLHVFGNARIRVGTDQVFSVVSTNGITQLQGINDAANAFEPLDIAGSDIRLSPGSTEAVRIDSSGNVGIGTTIPSYKLELTSQLGCTYSGDLRHLVNIDSNGGKSYWFDGTPTNTAWIIGDSGRAYFSGNVGIGTDNPTGKFSVYNSSSVTSSVNIDSVGRVLIGTTAQLSSSSEKLTVANGMTFLKYNSANTAPLYLRNEDFTASTYQPYLTMQDGSGNRGAIGIENNTSSLWMSGQTAILFRGGTSAPGNAELMRITGTGNVGIGTNDPSEKLDVEGAINCDAIYGKRFTDSTTVDTGIYVGNTPYYAAIFEVTVSGNPNHYGSFAYRCSSTYMVHIGTGWTGSDVSTIINATRISYGVGGSGNSSEVTASFVLWNGSTEYNSGVARNSSHQLRIKLSGLSTPSGAVVNIKQIHRL